jgi:hypothetical protein
MADQRSETDVGARAFIGCTVTRSAEPYSTGQIADRAAQTTASTATAKAVQRQPADGSRPSGKRITENVVSISARAVGQTPSHAHHWLPVGTGECPT